MVAPCPVDVKNSAPLMVEVNVLVLRHGKEFVASGISEPRGGNGVGFIVATAFQHIADPLPAGPDSGAASNSPDLFGYLICHTSD